MQYHEVKKHMQFATSQKRNKGQKNNKEQKKL